MTLTVHVQGAMVGAATHLHVADAMSGSR